MALTVIEPYGQLVRALGAVLASALNGLVAPGNIQPGYRVPEFAAALDSNTVPDGALPAVDILITTSVTAPNTSGGQTSRQVVPPIVAGDLDAATLSETRALLTSFTLFVVAADPRGAQTRDLIAGTVSAALGALPSGSLPLPDGPVATPDWSLGPRLYDLRASLVAGRMGPDQRYTARGLYKYDLAYTARHNLYTSQSVPVVRGVGWRYRWTIPVTPPA